MEFTEGKCPECKENLHIPADREHIICMFCGKEINTKSAIQLFQDTQPEQTEDLLKKGKKEFDSAAFESLRSQSISGMEDMILSIENPMNTFSRKLYEVNFSAYCEKYTDILNAVLDAAYMVEDSEAFFKEAADELVSRMSSRLEKVKKKREKDDRLLDYNMIMVTYFFPAMLERNDLSLNKFADIITAAWKTYFPATNLEPATFQQINSGFKKRFCYITTAVCKSLNKPDNCYELTVLRSYRDDYLMQTDQGNELIRIYYDVAPTIVKHINRENNCERIYKEIWEKYLSPCIKLIENNENAECELLYETMVYQLKDRYFH